MPLLVGERINGSGSRIVRRLMLAGDEQGILDIAHAQLAAGAQALDVCAAIPGEPGEADRLRALVALLTGATAAPLLIDSADSDALIAGLSASGRRAAVVNSVNLADRRNGLDRIAPLARERADTVIAQTIDEDGAPETTAGTLRLALRLVQILTDDYGVALNSIWIDPVLLPLVHARGAAGEALAALRRIKSELPGVSTVLAISNLSWGIEPRLRPALSSVFLQHAAWAGLDVAIADPARLLSCDQLADPEWAAAEALLFASAGAVRRRARNA